MGADKTRGRKSTVMPDPSAKSPAARGTRDERDVGSALRAAYQRAVEEDIPAEMLDLLSKLR